MLDGVAMPCRSLGSSNGAIRDFPGSGRATLDLGPFKVCCLQGVLDPLRSPKGGVSAEKRRKLEEMIDGCMTEKRGKEQMSKIIV